MLLIMIHRIVPTITRKLASKVQMKPADFQFEDLGFQIHLDARTAIQ
jgi:hypothetical protein